MPLPDRSEDLVRSAKCLGRDRYPLLNVVFCHAIPQRVPSHLQEAAGFGDVA